MEYGFIQVRWRVSCGREALDLDFFPCGQGHSQHKLTMTVLGTLGESRDGIL